VTKGHSGPKWDVPTWVPVFGSVFGIIIPAVVFGTTVGVVVIVLAMAAAGAGCAGVVLLAWHNKHPGGRRMAIAIGAFAVAIVLGIAAVVTGISKSRGGAKQDAEVGAPPETTEPILTTSSSFRNASSGLCLSAPSDTSEEGGRVTQEPCDPRNDAKLWYPDDLGLDRWGNRVYRLKNVASGKCLAIAAGSDLTEDRLAMQWTCSDSKDQEWAYDRGHRLHNAATFKCLMVPNGSREMGTGLIQKDCDTSLDQKWD
jgi:hypothetical protein